MMSEENEPQVVNIVNVSLPEGEPLNVLDDDSAHLSPDERAAGKTLAHKLEARQADIAGGRDSAHHYIPTEEDEESYGSVNMFKAMADLDESQKKLVRAILCGVDNQHILNRFRNDSETRRIETLQKRIRNFAGELEATVGDWTPKDVIANLRAIANGSSRVPTEAQAKETVAWL